MYPNTDIFVIIIDTINTSGAAGHLLDPSKEAPNNGPLIGISPWRWMLRAPVFPWPEHICQHPLTN